MNALRLSVRDAAVLRCLPTTMIVDRGRTGNGKLRSTLSSLQMRRLIRIEIRGDRCAGHHAEATVIATDDGRKALAIWKRENPHIGLDLTSRELEGLL